MHETSACLNVEACKTGFDAFIFDLDGTLLDTLPDLVVTVNSALESMGYPTRTKEEILSFVGDGGRLLMTRALPSDCTEDTIEKAFALFKSNYDEFGLCLTQEFEGITDVLSQLKQEGKKLAVLSNKFDKGVQDVVNHFFPSLFDVAHGEGERIPRKPDPTGLILTLEELGVSAERAVYFGDTAGDMKTASGAGVYSVGCLWGYQPKERILSENPQVLISEPRQILAFR
ncbi:MAG: HAD family hydrolase [Anaerotardibacter sp.]